MPDKIKNEFDAAARQSYWYERYGDWKIAVLATRLECKGDDEAGIIRSLEFAGGMVEQARRHTETQQAWRAHLTLRGPWLWMTLHELPFMATSADCSELVNNAIDGCRRAFAIYADESGHNPIPES